MFQGGGPGARRTGSKELGTPLLGPGAAGTTAGAPAQASRKPSPGMGRPGMPGNKQAIAPGQPAPASRQKDKFVPLPSFHSLPEEEERPFNQSEDERRDEAPRQSLFEDLPLVPAPQLSMDRRGRVSLYCIAETFDRIRLEKLLIATYPSSSIKSYPDCFYVDYLLGSDGNPGQDIFFFDYGVVACWGMTKNQERTVVRGIAAQVQEHPLPEDEMEIDEFQFNFSATEKPHVQNDTVVLSRKFLHDAEMKLAISYALAQSTKLSVYEQAVVNIVLESKNLPESLAETGKVDISSNEIAKMIGRVFLQKSALNLMSSVLDTPEFFWHAPDVFQTLYTRVTEYLELSNRVELLNSRFSVLQEMLDMLRDHLNNSHSTRLEWIVIWLIVIEVVVGVFELLGLFGFVGVGH